VLDTVVREHCTAQNRTNTTAEEPRFATAIARDSLQTYLVDTACREFLLRPTPSTPPFAKSLTFGSERGQLRRTQCITHVELVRVLRVSFEHHQLLVIKNEIWSLIEQGELHKSRFEFISKLQRDFIAFGGELAQFNKSQGFDELTGDKA
jgi:hypothetical protein